MIGLIGAGKRNTSSEGSSKVELVFNQQCRLEPGPNINTRTAPDMLPIIRCGFLFDFRYD